MNTTPDHDEHEFVPEVDAAALLAANPHSTQTPPVGSAAPLPAEASQPDDPEQALKQLPPALTAHIQELIAQAETQGYIRGRNEQIDATQHFDDTAPGCGISPSSMPHYGRCSIWDL